MQGELWRGYAYAFTHNAIRSGEDHGGWAYSRGSQPGRRHWGCWFSVVNGELPDVDGLASFVTGPALWSSRC